MFRKTEYCKWHGLEDLVIKMTCKHVQFVTNAILIDIMASWCSLSREILHSLIGWLTYPMSWFYIVLMWRGIINWISQIEIINYATQYGFNMREVLKASQPLELEPPGGPGLEWGPHINVHMCEDCGGMLWEHVNRILKLFAIKL